MFINRLYKDIGAPTDYVSGIKLKLKLIQIHLFDFSHEWHTSFVLYMSRHTKNIKYTKSKNIYINII